MLKTKNQVRHYILEEQLLISSDNSIFKGINITTDSYVIIKKIEGIKNIRPFKSKYFVGIKDIFHENNYTYIIFEYFDGLSIEYVLKNRGALDSSEAAYITYKTATAINFLLENNHYKINFSPEIVILDKDGTIKLFYYILEENNYENSLYYKAPELINSGEIDSIESNIYSLSIFLYELLTGLKPFMGEKNLSLIKSIKNGKYYSIRKMNSRACKSLCKICKKGMILEPNRRYSSFYKLQLLLKEYLDKRPLSSPITALLRPNKSTSTFEELFSKVSNRPSKSKHTFIILFLISIFIALLYKVLPHIFRLWF